MALPQPSGRLGAQSFNLHQLLRDAIPTIERHEVTVLMHNDAVVQGLSEVPFMLDVEYGGVIASGSGLGNALFSNWTAGKE